jgi:flagellar hook-basal body complex protein FliE
MPNSAAKLAELARTNPMHYTANGVAGILDGGASSGDATKGGASFQDALLKAMDGVSSSQTKSDNLLQKVVADPNSVDAQDVTIAMAEANMSLNLAKTILSRIVTAWKDVINTR